MVNRQPLRSNPKLYMNHSSSNNRNIMEQPDRFDFLRDLTPGRIWLAIGILVVGLTFTFFLSNSIRQEIESSARKEFDFNCNEIQINIARRLESNALVLYSGAALFAASDDVSRQEWHTFTRELRIEQQMPGTQGIGFAQLILPDQLESHIRQIQGEGFPDYQVHPEGKREVYSSIVYLEPFSGRNLRAFGYDMFSEPVRRAAMERARDEDAAALSGKVTLVQETNQDVQSGALLYVPVYRNGAAINTVEERRAALVGWVYSPYRMNDMVRGTLSSYELKEDNKHIVLQIYDGDTMTPDTLLFDSRTEEEKVADPDPKISKVIQDHYFGEPWTLKFAQLGGLSSIADYSTVWLVMFGGTVISLLVFGLTVSLLRTAHYLASIRLLADTDALTDVYNRRKFLELAESEFVRARRHKKPMTILMVDLNFFKRINDNFGHIVGDRALRMAASAIQSTLRKNIDQVGRFGGDEFIILLPETSLDQVGHLCARLRATVTAETQQIADGVDPVSLSIGGAELDETTTSLDILIERADRAMYADKREAKG